MFADSRATYAWDYTLSLFTSVRMARPPTYGELNESNILTAC